VDGGHVVAEGGEDGVAVAGFGGEDGEDVDHGGSLVVGEVVGFRGRWGGKPGRGMGARGGAWPFRSAAG
jgi:hypothetical protein